MKRLTINIIFCLVAIISSLQLSAQKQLEHPKKIYQSPDGKLYINKALPIYLRLATSPDENAKTYLLQSEDSKAYTNPMYFDTEGMNTFRSPSKVDTATKKVVYPIEDIIFELFSDSEAPRTRIVYSEKNIYKDDSVKFFTGKLNISFTVFDATSGIEDTYISINASPYKKFTDTIAITDEKVHTLKYYSVDNVGNVEDVRTVYIAIDKTNPVSKLNIEIDKYNEIVSPRSSLEIISEDGFSGLSRIYYSFNEGTERVYYRPISLQNFREGEHTFRYFATDKVGNKEEVHEYTFYLDRTAPIIVDELLGNTFIANGLEYSSGRSRVKLTAMDNKAGVKEISYSINNGDFVKYTKPFTLAKSGKLIIQTFVSDNVNNQKVNTIMTGKSNISYIDLSGPSLRHSYVGPHFKSKDTLYITEATKIRLAGRDDEAGFKKIQYQIDNQTSEEYSEPFTVKGLGMHVVKFTGFDNVDNTNNSEFKCYIDTVGPKIYHRFSILSDRGKMIDGDSIDVYPSHAVLFLSATDTEVGFDRMTYSINGGAEKKYTSLISQFIKNKKYHLVVTAFDKLGNKSTHKIDFYIE